MNLQRKKKKGKKDIKGYIKRIWFKMNRTIMTISQDFE